MHYNRYDLRDFAIISITLITLGGEILFAIEFVKAALSGNYTCAWISLLAIPFLFLFYLIEYKIANTCL